MNTYLVTVGGSITVTQARSRPDAIHRVATRLNVRPDLRTHIRARKATAEDLLLFDLLAEQTHPGTREGRRHVIEAAP